MNNHLPKTDTSELKSHFSEITTLITNAQRKAYQAVNTCLIDLYWQVGEYISRKLEAAEWGKE